MVIDASLDASAEEVQRIIRAEDVDIAHINRLTPLEQFQVQDVVERFYENVSHYFTNMYLHLDVDESGKKMREKGFAWKVLLITNNGRYYASDEGFGVKESLKRTLETLSLQVTSRLERMSDAERKRKRY